MNYLEWVGKIGQIMAALQTVRLDTKKGEEQTIRCSIRYKYKGETYRLAGLIVSKD